MAAANTPSPPLAQAPHHRLARRPAPDCRIGCRDRSGCAASAASTSRYQEDLFTRDGPGKLGDARLTTEGGSRSPCKRRQALSRRCYRNGDPCRARTYDLALRRHLLYPAELRDRLKATSRDRNRINASRAAGDYSGNCRYRRRPGAWLPWAGSRGTRYLRVVHRLRPVPGSRRSA